MANNKVKTTLYIEEDLLNIVKYAAIKESCKNNDIIIRAVKKYVQEEKRQDMTELSKKNDSVETMQ